MVVWRELGGGEMVSQCFMETEFQEDDEKGLEMDNGLRRPHSSVNVCRQASELYAEKELRW